MRQVICLSTSNFYPFPTRKQNVMTRLSGAEILYFDPPVTILAPLKDKAAWKRLWAWRKGPEHPKENISVYALPPVLPFFNKLRWLNRFNQKYLSQFIRRRMKKHGWSQPLLWCYSPASADILRHLPHQALVYDCVDRHSAYQGMIDPELVDAEERQLAAAADIVFCTAQGLYETLAPLNRHTYMIPNGADYELFSQAAHKRPPEKGRKILGFVGMLQDCLAYDLIIAAADAFPEAEIELIGRVMPGVDISQLTARPNIRLTGLLPQSQLPERMSRFAACLNLFAPGRLSKDVSPLKFYEYLATGLPVVSTPEPLQVLDYGDMVYIARTREEFIAACSRAMAEDDEELRRRRQEAGQAASWDKRVAQMEEKLSQAGLW